MKSKKGLAGDVVDTFPTYARLAYDVTGTVCWAKNGGIHDRINFSSFSVCFCLFFSNRDEDANKILLC